MRQKNGFSLVELLITMVIMGIVMALTGPIYTRVLTGVKEETVSSEVHQDLANSTELIRLDIEHAGFGIARDDTSMPVTWAEHPAGPPPGGTLPGPAPAPPTLELRSVLNNTNQTTMGWALLDCTGAAAGSAISNAAGGNYIVNHKSTLFLQSMVLLDPDENFGGLVTPSNYSCPTTPGIYTAFPFDSTGFDACNTGWCTRITYHLSTAAHGPPTSRSACAQGTFDLRRRIGNAVIGSPVGDPVIASCVADFRVRFDIDTTANGVQPSEAQLSVLPVYATAGALMDQVKNIEILLLIQAGRRNDDLNTAPNTTVSGAILSLAGVPNANNYRWKVLKISGNPMSWR